jgi:thymidylate kinase
MIKRKVISISGVDGSGKSIIAHLLMRLLRRCSNARSEIVWFRWRAVTLYALYLYSRFRGLYVRVYVPWLRRWFGIHVFHVDAVARRLYPYLLFIDLTIFYFLYKMLWWVRGIRVVIFDRFYFDALVDAIYTCRSIDRVFLRLYITAQERASSAVVLDVDTNTAIARKKDIISRREIEFKRKLYLVLAKSLNITIVDAHQELQQVLSNVCNVLNLDCYQHHGGSYPCNTNRR